MTIDIAAHPRDVFRELIEKLQRDSERIERNRIVGLIHALPRTPCHCEDVFVEAGWHATDCWWASEEAFAERLIEAITGAATPSDEESSASRRPNSTSGTPGGVAAAALRFSSSGQRGRPTAGEPGR